MRQLEKSAKVVIYTTPHCPHCQHAKKWLKRNKIPFLDFNVGKTGKMQKQFFQLGGRNVPLIIIGKQQFDGFNPSKLKAVLEHHGLLSMG